MLIVEYLLLVGIANATPVLAQALLGRRFSRPLDGGLCFFDGQPLFGRSKTLRGLVLAVLVTTLLSPLLGFDWPVGALTGLFAMSGDLFSSFIKRRLRLPSSAKATGLDQIPESLFPALACQPLLGFDLLDLALIVAAFFVSERLLSPLFYRLSIRKRPY